MILLPTTNYLLDIEVILYRNSTRGKETLNKISQQILMIFHNIFYFMSIILLNGNNPGVLARTGLGFLNLKQP